MSRTGLSASLAVLVTALSVTLTACAAPAVDLEPAGAAPIERGSILELTRPVIIPGGNASVYIQNGTTLEPGTEDPYHAWCKLIMKTLSPLPRRIEPARFRVIDIVQEVEDVSLGRQHYAALGMDLAGGATADDYITTFYLASEDVPDVDSLSCAHWEDPTLSPRHLTIREIRKTLGELLIFR